LSRGWGGSCTKTKRRKHSDKCLVEEGRVKEEKVFRVSEKELQQLPLGGSLKRGGSARQAKKKGAYRRGEVSESRLIFN